MKSNKVDMLMPYKHSFLLKQVNTGLRLLIYFACMCMPCYGVKADVPTFKNPILREGPDPWVYKHTDGNYYLMVTRGDRLDVWKSSSLSTIAQSTPITLWKKPDSGPNSRDIWAPEIHHLNGKWYIYYTATDAKNPGDATRYVFVLENSSKDPLQGTWQDRGKVNTKYSGLDGSVFEHRGNLYFLYSAYVGPQSVLCIAPMQNPWTLASEEVIIAKPSFNWEKHKEREILEGPQILKGKKNTLHIVYSASACWDDNYALGMLTAATSSNLLEHTSWQKSPTPVFSKSTENGVYGPGHNSFTTSPDGKEDWIVYHAKEVANGECAGRSTRMQPFSWNQDGTPHFGVPLSTSTSIQVPSGEKPSTSKGASGNLFYNPLLPSGPDPWAMYKDGFYYYTHTLIDSIGLWRTKDITDLKNGEYKTIWIPTDPKNSKDLWAPEIHHINGKWYIYYAADDGNTDNHQLYVLENAAKNPFDGAFVMKGRIQTDPGSNWAIDGSVFEHQGDYYMIWSGWQTRRISTETQCIYIAKMANPWTLSSERVLISKPEFEWERNWQNPKGWTPSYTIYVNEGPQLLKNTSGDKVFIIYSASGCWTPHYALGMLAASATSNLLDATSWTKSTQPVFKQSPQNRVFGTGHNSFFQSPDGKEDWILYHANDQPENTCGPARSPRAQKIRWKADGIPDFGIALSTDTPILKPSGTK